MGDQPSSFSKIFNLSNPRQAEVLKLMNKARHKGKESNDEEQSSEESSGKKQSGEESSGEGSSSEGSSGKGSSGKESSDKGQSSNGSSDEGQETKEKLGKEPVDPLKHIFWKFQKNIGKFRKNKYEKDNLKKFIENELKNYEVELCNKLITEPECKKNNDLCKWQPSIKGGKGGKRRKNKKATGATPAAPGTPGAPPAAPGTPGATPAAPGTPGATPAAPGTLGATPAAPGTPGATSGAPGTPAPPGTPAAAPGADGTCIIKTRMFSKMFSKKTPIKPPKKDAKEIKKEVNYINNYIKGCLLNYNSDKDGQSAFFWKLYILTKQHLITPALPKKSDKKPTSSPATSSIASTKQAPTPATTPATSIKPAIAPTTTGGTKDKPVPGKSAPAKSAPDPILNKILITFGKPSDKSVIQTGGGGFWDIKKYNIFIDIDNIESITDRGINKKDIERITKKIEKFPFFIAASKAEPLKKVMYYIKNQDKLTEKLLDDMMKTKIKEYLILTLYDILNELKITIEKDNFEQAKKEAIKIVKNKPKDDVCGELTKLTTSLTNPAEKEKICAPAMVFNKCEYNKENKTCQLKESKSFGERIKGNFQNAKKSINKTKETVMNKIESSKIEKEHNKALQNIKKTKLKELKEQAKIIIDQDKKDKINTNETCYKLTPLIKSLSTPEEKKQICAPKLIGNDCEYKELDNKCDVKKSFGDKIKNIKNESVEKVKATSRNISQKLSKTTNNTRQNAKIKEK
jgi:hypothetical protein